MHRRDLLIFFISITFPSFSSSPPEVEFGEIDIASLEMTHYPLDSTASAVVLGDYGKSHFVYQNNSGLRVVFTRHTRIKILRSDAYNYANVYVNLYRQGSTEENVSRIKGYTYNLENGKVVKTKLKSNGKFEEKYNDNINRVKFTMPDVKEGSVIEYTYRITSPFLSNLQDWEFQRSIPTVWSEYKVEIPEYFRYQQLSRGYHPLAISEASNSSGSFMFAHRGRPGQGNNTEQNTLNFSQRVFRWAARDVPALVEEPYTTTMNDYTSQIVFELASINIPGQTYEDYSSSWEEVDEELLDHPNLGKVLDHTAAVRKVIEPVVAGATSDQEKMIRVFNYVRDHVKWNEETRLVASQSLKKTLSERVGNSADVNLLLVAMLREAGVATHPVVLSTRDHGLVLEAFPRINHFNYLIAQANINGAFHLLDATAVRCSYDVLPLRCLNQRGRVLSTSPADKWVSLQPAQPSTRLVVANLALKEDQLVGTITRSHSRYNAVNLRKKIADFSNLDNYIADAKQAQPGLRKYTLESVEPLEKPVKELMNVVLTSGVQPAGNLVYLNPFADAVADNPFKSAVRTYPVDYPHPQREVYMLTLTLPEGYVVEELPESLAIALPNQGGHYRFAASVRDNVIQVSSKFNISRTQFYTEEYAYLREFYQQMLDKQREQIVLVKQ